jgi:hypothetical protein
VALAERFIAGVTKNRPIVEVSPINGTEDDAASLCEGALITNFNADRLLSSIKSSMRMAFWSFPVMGYTFWDSGARNGLGDYRTRFIPPHRQLIDRTQWSMKTMEFHGFWEEASRAQLIMLFPDKTEDIEAAGLSSGQDQKPGMPADPWDSAPSGGRSNSVSRLVADDQGHFSGKQTVKVGGWRRGVEDPLAQKVRVEYVWFQDPTPIEEMRPKIGWNGKPKMKHSRHPDTDALLFDHHGWDVTNGPRGPLYQPKLKPKMEPEMEPVILKKYKRWRHIAWIPADKIILWDVDWDGPSPCWSVRTTYPLNEWWSEGQGLRLISLGIARNILYTIIFQRLKLSLGGTWLATHSSGLKRNKLTPEDGQVFYGKKIDNENVRQFPVQALDVAYINVLHEIESEMTKLIGLSPVQQGQAAGRADSAPTYDKLIEQAGTATVDCAQLMEESLGDWAEIGLWYMQQHYTHEHFVEVEANDGQTSWKQASRFALKGEMAIRIDTGSMVAHSESAQREVAKEGATLGIYPLPMLAKIGRYPQWRRALKLKMQLAGDPSKQPLMGAAGAPPGKPAHDPTAGARSHHKAA